VERSISFYCCTLLGYQTVLLHILLVISIILVYYKASNINRARASRSNEVTKVHQKGKSLTGKAPHIISEISVSMLPLQSFTTIMF
jgi:hypothetical protein